MFKVHQKKFMFKMLQFNIQQQKLMYRVIQIKHM